MILAMNSDARPLFSSRYGINSRDPEAEVWQQRHLASAAERTRFSCICPGGAMEKGRNPCQLRCTQEDLLCDECRAWCYAVDEEHRRYPFVQVHGGGR